jgi:hypothetical protein
MRCSFCTYDHKPENPFILKAHAEQDIMEGKTRGIIPVVVWDDGGFLLVEAADGRQIYDIGIVDSRPVEEVDLGFEPIPDEEESPLEDSKKATKL